KRALVHIPQRTGRGLRVRLLAMVFPLSFHVSLMDDELRSSMMTRRRVVAAAVLMLGSAISASAQTKDDTRTQYPAALANSYAALSVGAVDYLFLPQQLQNGFRASSVDAPHLTVRVALFGHEINR